MSSTDPNLLHSWVQTAWSKILLGRGGKIAHFIENVVGWQQYLRLNKHHFAIPQERG